MKNRSWPIGITVSMIIFMSLTLLFVKKAFSERVDLVSEDYYYRDKDFSERMEGEARFRRHGIARFSQNKNSIRIELPDYFSTRLAEGRLHFYSPLNPAEDFTRTFSTANGKISLVAQIPANQNWRGMLDFKSEGKSYFFPMRIP